MGKEYKGIAFMVDTVMLIGTFSDEMVYEF